MGILKTNLANCKDCYKCVRHCPVNAIKILDGHAQVDTDRCILDGKCYLVCPQRAKCVQSDLQKAKNIIKLNSFVIASVAPSVFSYYGKSEVKKLFTALKYLGFDLVEQTARTAYSVAVAHFDYYKKTETLAISSSCPACVNLVEKYYPDFIPNLAPVVSPMVAHYRLLKSEHKKPFEMIFIGPCIAKKQEAENTGIGACLTFEEIEQWLIDEGINLSELEEAEIDHFYFKNSSLFPLLGGLLKTAEMPESNFDNEIFSINGIENLKSFFDAFSSKKINAKFVEALACEGGCIMGPVRPQKCRNSSYYELKSNLINFFENEKDTVKPDLMSEKSLKRIFEDRSLTLVIPTEDEIKAVLASIEKTKPEHELNCGACGYNTCRDKAIAVIQGMAEKEMCIPYMKSRAERFSSIVLEATPNAILILDKNLFIIECNPAFLKLFELKKDEILGKHVSFVTDPEPFNEVLSHQEAIKEFRTVINSKEIKRIVFSVPDKKLITGIFVDITDIEKQKAVLSAMKTETIERAQKVINKQMRVAQEVAGLLGETTAETKVLLGQLVKILQQE